MKFVGTELDEIYRQPGGHRCLCRARGPVDYDATEVTHLNIGAAEAASAIKLTIENTGDDQLTVTAVSANGDPVDICLSVPSRAAPPGFRRPRSTTTASHRS